MHIIKTFPTAPELEPIGATEWLDARRLRAGELQHDAAPNLGHDLADARDAPPTVVAEKKSLWRAALMRLPTSASRVTVAGFSSSSPGVALPSFERELRDKKARRILAMRRAVLPYGRPTGWASGWARCLRDLGTSAPVQRTVGTGCRITSAALKSTIPNSGFGVAFRAKSLAAQWPGSRSPLPKRRDKDARRHVREAWQSDPTLQYS